jgi:hypothetical protein
MFWVLVNAARALAPTRPTELGGAPRLFAQGVVLCLKACSNIRLGQKG